MSAGYLGLFHARYEASAMRYQHSVKSRTAASYPCDLFQKCISPWQDLSMKEEEAAEEGDMEEKSEHLTPLGLLLVGATGHAKLHSGGT